MRHCLSYASVACVAMLISSVAFGQNAAPALQAFEVISVKPNLSGGEEANMKTSPGHLTAVNTTPYDLLQFAFGVKDSQLVGVPNWFTRERFDFDGVTGTAVDLNRVTLQPFLQSMFADRFHLRFHRENRESPVYSLVVAKGGPKLKVNSGEGRSATGIHSVSGTNRVNATRTTMKRFAEVLSEQTDRIVIDNTGLPGEYDFTLEWVSGLGGDSTEPPVFTAIQEGLGLKLQSAKGPVPIVVIDSVERPSAN